VSGACGRRKLGFIVSLRGLVESGDQRLQLGDQHALLRLAEPEAGEQEAEGLDLLLAAGECEGARAGAGCVRVADRVYGAASVRGL